MTTGYHCSASADLADRLQASSACGLCVANDANVARLYLRGEGPHYLYTFAWNASELTVAGESEIIAAWRKAFPRRDWDDAALPVWDAAKDARVRAALLSDGYDALVYGDSHEGCDYETTEFLRRPTSLRAARVETIEGE